VSNQFHVSVLSDKHLCNQSIVSVSSACCQYIVSVLSETLFIRAVMDMNLAPTIDTQQYPVLVDGTLLIYFPNIILLLCYMRTLSST